MFLCNMPLPAWGGCFQAFSERKNLPHFLRKRCTQLTIMCNMPARREGSTFGFLTLFVKTGKKLKKS